MSRELKLAATGSELTAPIGSIGLAAPFLYFRDLAMTLNQSNVVLVNYFPLLSGILASPLMAKKCVVYEKPY